MYIYLLIYFVYFIKGTNYFESVIIICFDIVLTGINNVSVSFIAITYKIFYYIMFSIVIHSKDELILKIRKVLIEFYTILNFNSDIRLRTVKLTMLIVKNSIYRIFIINMSNNGHRLDKGL